MGAKLYITYDKRTLPSTTPSGYFMYTKVRVKTDPDDIKKCLVIRRGMVATSDEILARVATLSDLDTLSELPERLNCFHSESLPATQSGETLTIRITTLPPLWEVAGQTVPMTLTMFARLSDKYIILTTPLPTYARGFTYTVTQTVGRTSTTYGPFTDGEVTRYYTTTDTDWLTSEHYDFFTDVDVADDKYVACQAQAQSLVTAWNAGIFSGVSTELYE